MAPSNDEENYSEAIQYFRKAAEWGHAEEQCLLGFCFEFGAGVSQDCEQAVYWYRKAAEQDHAEAQYLLGFCFQVGFGVPQDTAQAVYWYRKAAEQGHRNAQAELGAYYYSVPQDYEQAVLWFYKAAKQGCACSQKYLGDCYFDGKWVTKNRDLALYYYEQALINKSDISENNIKDAEAKVKELKGAGESSLF